MTQIIHAISYGETRLRKRLIRRILHMDDHSDVFQTQFLCERQFGPASR